jgi:hypothetical protein
MFVVFGYPRIFNVFSIRKDWKTVAMDKTAKEQQDEDIGNYTKKNFVPYNSLFRFSTYLRTTN